MKRFISLTLALTATLCIAAMPNFNATKRYHIVCEQFPQGCVVDGASVGQQTPVYYQATASTSDATYWIFTEEATGQFSIKNAGTGRYVTYDGVRDTYRRYVSMTDQIDGNNSLWTIVQWSEGLYSIRNVAQTDQVWDVRTDSYMVGTYSRQNDLSSIERFYFYDQQGSQVTETMQPTAQGYDVSSWLVATTDALEGWTVSGPWMMNTGAGGSHYNGSASTVAPFIESWHATNQGGLGTLSLQQSLTTLPAGQYTLQADIIAVWQGTSGWYNSNPEAPATNTTLFANNNSISVGTANNIPERYQLAFTLENTRSVNLGIKATNTNANWIAIDNISIFYQGSEQQLLEGERQKVRTELADYYEPSEIEALLQQAGNDFAALEALRKSTANLPKADPLSRALSQLAIDGHAPVYVESLDLYLCAIPLASFRTNYEATVTYTPKQGAGTLTIGNKTVNSGDRYTFTSVQGSRNYVLKIQTPDGNTLSKNLTFTSLPVVRMYGTFNDNYSQGTIGVYEPDKAAPEMLNMKAKWRGGITNTAGKNKRNYHVKLLDQDGNKLETKFFGLRNDNSWILESCQVDMSRIRNRVLTDLWNDYSTPPYYKALEPKAMTGTRGHFVELVLNGEYRGIYCMTENMDRKQMKLMKFDETTGDIRGQLWKSKDWSYATFMGTIPDGNYWPKDYLSNPDAWNEMWDFYQVKYPALEDLSPTDWSPLYNAVNFVCTASDSEFASNAASYFDLPLLIDYYILMETILSSDNHGKNMFFAIYDQKQSKKITFSVWDMDATCGQRWSDDYYHSTIMQPEQDYATYIANWEHGDYNLFKRLRSTDADNFNMKTRLRYRDLRQNYLATENILDRFRNYLNEFNTCGADKREYAKWNYNSDIAGHVLNFDDEMRYLTDWFTRRMAYLDTYRFDIASLPTDISDTQTKDNSNDTIVYDLKGQRMGTIGQLHNMPAGIYIIGGRKVVVNK